MLRRIFLTVLGAAIFSGGLSPALTLADERFIVVASTTSTEDSGLFEYLLPIFTQKNGIRCASSQGTAKRSSSPRKATPRV